MTDKTDIAALRTLSLQRVKEIANGDSMLMGERVDLANTALRFHKELGVAVDGFKNAATELFSAQDQIEEECQRADDAERAALKGDQVPFMYAICHPDGSAWMDEGCVALDQSHLGVVLADLRRDTGEDYHMVPVFTHPKPVPVVVLPGISELIDTCDSTPAVRDVHVWDLAISEVKRLNPSLLSDNSAAGGIVKDGE